MDFLCRLAMFLLLLLSGLFLCLAQPYHFVNKPMKWIDAQAHCQEHYTDLASVDDAEDMARLMQSINGNYSDSAWIGLYDDTLNSWRWSLGNDTFYKEGERDFRQWWDKPDNYGGNELCAVMVFDNKWHDAPCDYTFPVICYDGREDVNETYVLIPQFMNWTDGQKYCRKHHTDLVSVRNEAEYQNVIQILGSGIAWLGLYRTRSWSDQSNSTFTYWREGEPDNGQQTVEEGKQHCTAVSFNTSGRWTDENCNRSLAFICYGDPLTFNETIPVLKTPPPISVFTTEASTTPGLGHQDSTGLTSDFGNSTSSADITPSIQSMVPEYSEASTLIPVPDETLQIASSSTTSIPFVTNTKNTSGNQSSMTSTSIPTRGTTTVNMVADTTPATLSVFSATTRFSHEISTPTSTQNPKSTSTPVSTGSSTPPAEPSPSVSTTDYKSVSTTSNNQTNNYTPAVRSYETTKLPPIPVDKNYTLQLTPTLSLNQTSTGTLTPNISVGFDVTVSHTTTNKTVTIPTTTTPLSPDNNTGSTGTPSSTGSVQELYGSSLSPSSDASSRPFSTLSTVPNSTESSTLISSQATTRSTTNISLTVRNGDTSSVHSMVAEHSEGSTLISIPPSSTTSIPRVTNTRNSSGTQSSRTSKPIPTRGTTTVDVVSTNDGGADTTPATTLSGSLSSGTTPYEAPLTTADATFMAPTSVVSDSFTDSISAPNQTQEPPSNQSTTAGSTSTLSPTFTAFTAPAPNLTDTTPGIIPPITSFSSPPLNQTSNHTLTSQVKVTSSQTSNPISTHVANSYSTLTPTIPITSTPANITPLVTPVTNQTSNRTTTVVSSLTSTLDPTVFSATTRFSEEISTPTDTQKSTSNSVFTESSTPPAEPSPTLSTTDYNQTNNYTPSVRSYETTKLPPIPVDNLNDTLQLIPTASLSQTSTGTLTPNISVGFDVTVSHATTNETVATASTPLSPSNMPTVSSVGSIRELYGSSLSPTSAASSSPFSTLSTVPNSSESSTYSVQDMASQATTRSITSISLTVRNGDTFGTEASLHSPFKNTSTPTLSTTPGDSIGTATVNSTTVTGSPTSSGDIVGSTNISGTKTSAVSVSKYTHGPPSTDFSHASDFTSKPTARPAHSSTLGNSSLISNATSSVTKTTPTTTKSPSAQYTLKLAYSTTSEYKGMANLTSSPTHLHLQPTSSRLDTTDTTADQPSSPAGSFFTTEPRSAHYSSSHPSTNSHVIGLSAKLISHSQLTQSDIEELITEQFGERLRRHGISSHITLRYVQRIEP